jgi:hypothetical protein
VTTGGFECALITRKIIENFGKEYDNAFEPSRPVYVAGVDRYDTLRGAGDGGVE